MQEKTNVELLEILRLAENMSVPGSRYQLALNEWNIRQSEKAAKSNGGIFIEAAGDITFDGAIHTDKDAIVSLSSASSIKAGKNAKIKQFPPTEQHAKKSFSMENPFVYLAVGIILIVIGYFFKDPIKVFIGLS